MHLNQLGHGVVAVAMICNKLRYGAVAGCNQLRHGVVAIAMVCNRLRHGVVAVAMVCVQ